MRATVLLLRRQGAVIRQERDYPRPIIGELLLDQTLYGEDHLHRLKLLPSTSGGAHEGEPLAVLFDPHLLRLRGPYVVFRGIERVPASGEMKFAGMVQEWRVTPL